MSFEHNPNAGGKPPRLSTPEEITSRQVRMAQLRQSIRYAEESENEKRVLELEAELHALEKGEEFDLEAHRAKREGTPRKGEILKQMQNFTTSATDKWSWDGVYHPLAVNKTYDSYFRQLLREEGYGTFLGLVEGRAEELGRPVNVLDLFGGAYLLPNLEHVSHVVGVRLKNVDDEFDSRDVELLKSDMRREILEGNLYEGKTWKQLEHLADEREIDGFDVITCRPQGPFGHNSSYSTGIPSDIVEKKTMHAPEIYVSLLNRTLDLLSPEGGTLFLQQPVLMLNSSVKRAFWEKYTEEKGREGYEFFFDTEHPEDSERVMVRRTQPQEEEKAQ